MAVAPIRPGFWLQHASNEARQLVSFAAELGQQPHGRPGISFGPVNAPGTMNELFEGARLVGDAILDPHGHFLDREHTKRSRDHFPWLALSPRPATQTQWEQWVQAALDHQLSPTLRRSASPPSFVVTASPLIEAARGAIELYTVMDAAVAVRSRQPSPGDCWLGVTVDRVYVRENPHLTRLANAMLAANVDGFVFRASQSQLAPVDDARYLAGLREIVEMCADNGIRVFLPNSGWVGWLAMAWGAWGFSGGMAAGTWVDRIPGPMTRPQRPSEPYFEYQLLRSLPWRVHEQLRGDPSYVSCRCVDCQQMGNTHDSALAKRHQIRDAYREDSVLGPMTRTQRRTYIGSRLDGAIQFRDGLPLTLRGRVGSEFLDRWRLLV